MVKFQWCQNRSFVSASPNLSGERQPTGIVSVPWSYRTLFTFFLDKKSNKKIKAKRIAPLVLP